LEKLKGLSVLHVIAPAPFGGMESVVGMLAAGHARRGHSIRVATVLSPGRAPHPFVASLELEGVAVIPLHVGDRDYLTERRAIRALCRKYCPDVVHTHGFRPDVVDGWAALTEGIPVVSTCHGFIESNWRGRAFQWLQRRALRRFDAVIAVSASIASKLRASGVPPERIHLLFNAYAEDGKPLSRESARRLLDLPDALVIGWVGRLSAEKGPDIALEAFAQLHDRDVRLLIVGEGREQTRLRERAEALGVSERLLWRGMVPNAGKLFPAFDAFLLSSRTEGTPMALLEAMAANVPIVATRVGGVPDVVDSLSAWLIESLDSEGMARALGELLSQPELARARAERALQRLKEHFAIGPWLSQYESIYRAVLRSEMRTTVGESLASGL
jgi:glycosyltransferase involved in cell wall biosynthesis